MLTPEEIAKLPSSKIGIRGPINDLRRDIQQIGDKVKALTGGTAPTVQSVDKVENRNEAISNVVLAYRHLEDARMRLGKVLQAVDGGVSIFD